MENKRIKIKHNEVNYIVSIKSFDINNVPLQIRQFNKSLPIYGTCIPKQKSYNKIVLKVLETWKK